VIELLPHAGERRKAQLGAGRVQRPKMRIPDGAALLPDRGMHLALVLVAGRGEPCPEGGRPGAGSG
jgi:hypothetical protein